MYPAIKRDDIQCNHTLARSGCRKQIERVVNKRKKIYLLNYALFFCHAKTIR